MYVCMYVCVYVCVYVCICVCMYVPTYVYTYAFLYNFMYVYMYICTYFLFICSSTSRYSFARLVCLLEHRITACDSVRSFGKHSETCSSVDRQHTQQRGTSCELLYLHSLVTEESLLLGCKSMLLGNVLATFRRNPLI